MKPKLECDHLSELITTVVDREATPAEQAEIDAHIATCPGCAAELRRQQQLARGLKQELHAWLEAGTARPAPRRGQASLRRRFGAAASAIAALLSLVIVIAAIGWLLRTQWSARGAPRPSVVYGVGTLSVGTTSGTLVSIELPTGRVLGQFAAFGGQGGILAISPDGSRGYFFDGQQLHELALPGVQLLRSTPVPRGINTLGYARIVAVALDGTEVYIETMDKPGDPPSEYGIAVYDVAQGAFVHQIRLAPPLCKVAQLYALSQHRLAILCGSDHVVRILDVASGDQQPATLPVNAGNAILSTDRRHLYVVSGAGQIQEVDLERLVIARTASLAQGVECPRCVPNQPLHLSADGQRLTVVAAPGPPDVEAAVNGTVVWIVDVPSLTRVAEVPVGPHIADAALTPDGHALVVSRIELDPQQNSALRLIEVPSGQEIGHWPGSIFSLEIRT